MYIYIYDTYHVCVCIGDKNNRSGRRHIRKPGEEKDHREEVCACVCVLVCVCVCVCVCMYATFASLGKRRATVKRRNFSKVLCILTLCSKDV